ncbi:MAG: antitoxin family protein [Dehalococcoidia bacterium]
MPRTLRMTFDGDVFRPSEPVNLPAGTEYEVTIHNGEVERSAHERPLMKYLDLAQDVDLPPDFAAQHHHYLHGIPKR